MTDNLSTKRNKGAKAPQTHAAAVQAEPDIDAQIIHVERSGDWMPADELREAALASVTQGKNVVLELDGIDHLDASALQILLALDLELKKRKRTLRLEKASAHLREWFDFAGADERFFAMGQKSDE